MERTVSVKHMASVERSANDATLHASRCQKRRVQRGAVVLSDDMRALNKTILLYTWNKTSTWKEHFSNNNAQLIGDMLPAARLRGNDWHLITPPSRDHGHYNTF
eukprot:5502069-Pyramimonas_sp.AAC.1